MKIIFIYLFFVEEYVYKLIYVLAVAFLLGLILIFFIKGAIILFRQFAKCIKTKNKQAKAKKKFKHFEQNSPIS